MRGPLEVRLKTPERDEIVGDLCQGVTFRKTAPGGYASGSLKLIGRWQDWSLGPGSQAYVYDATDGETVWEGYLDNPGQSHDVDGETFDIGAQGAQTVVGDRSEILVYLDSSFEHWRADDRNDHNLAPSADASAASWPDTEKEAILLQFASGTPIAKSSEARAIHDLCDSAPMGVAAYSFLVKSGLNAQGYKVRVTGSSGTFEEKPMATESVYMANILGVGGFDAPTDVLKLRLRRTKGATNIGTDRVWTGFAEPYVLGRRFDLQGRDQISIDRIAQVDLTRVLSHEIVRDLIYRMMPMIDNRMCWIDAGSYEIDQLCYADPVRPSGVLEDMELFEPDMTWLVGASGDTGKHSFTYQAWPTEARYEISVADGYSAPGGEADLCSEITVGYVDAKGVERSVKVFADVPELNGRERAADKITLDESVSSKRNAQRIGEQALRLLNNPPKAATATVTRPVWDSAAGRFIPAWRMEPGECVMVRQAGEVLRLTELEFNSDDYAVGLTLGEPAPTIEQLIARLSKSKRRKR